MSEESFTDASRCCASCGIAEIDELKLMECSDCDLVNIAATNVRKIINHSTRKHVRDERLNYVTRFYSSNRTVRVVGTVQSVSYHCRLIQISCRFAAAK
jgi:hypothetical protein